MDLLAELYIYIDSVRDSLNKKAVRTLKACELYLFDFDMYSLRHVYVYVFCVFELLYLGYLPLATPICCNLFLFIFML